MINNKNTITQTKKTILITDLLLYITSSSWFYDLKGFTEYTRQIFKKYLVMMIHSLNFV